MNTCLTILIAAFISHLFIGYLYSLQYQGLVDENNTLKNMLAEKDRQLAKKDNNIDQLLVSLKQADFIIFRPKHLLTATGSELEVIDSYDKSLLNYWNSRRSNNKIITESNSELTFFTPTWDNYESYEQEYNEFCLSQSINNYPTKQIA